DSLDPDAAVISFSSPSKAYLAPGWRTGCMAVGRTPRLDPVVAGGRKLADGRRCCWVPLEHGVAAARAGGRSPRGALRTAPAVAAALTGDRSHQVAFRTALRERAELTVERLGAIPGVSCVAPTAAFYAMPQVTLPRGRTDEDYVLALLRATGVLCVFGSGFGLP